MVVAAVGVPVAIRALATNGRARWLYYPQIALWLFVLVASIVLWASVHSLLESVGRPRELLAGLLGCDIPAVIAVVLLALTLWQAWRRAA
jgi:hypothetical protein